MKNLLLCLLCVVAVSAVFAQDNQAFVYNEHGKRDPFAPLVSPNGSLISYDSNIAVSDMSLEGVVIDPQGKNLAIINGKIVKSGDLVGLYTVESIANDHVNLMNGKEHLTVKLKKGEV